MADLNDTYVVHTAATACSMGMRQSCAVLGNSHGVYLRQQPQMTVNDSLPMVNVMCFGGCYSMENPSTQAAAAAMQAAVLAACPDTFLDKVMNFFTGGKKKAKTQAAQEGVPRVVGVCTPTIPPGTKWDNGKDGVETKGNSPLLGGAKIRCLFGGEIQIVDSGQVEGAGSAESYENEDGGEAEGAAGASAAESGAAGAAGTAAGSGTPGAVGICTGAAAVAASVAREAGAAVAKEQLKASLDTAVDGYITPGQRIATLPCMGNDEALEVVLSHDAAIEAASEKYNVDKEMIQSVLFQELRFYNVGDPVADSIVRQSQFYEHQLEAYEKAGFLEKMVRGVPVPPIVYRKDSSTGLGQIFASTAIDATNLYEKTNYDRNDKKDLEKFWNELQDEDYNIDMVGRVLAYKRSTLPEGADAKRIMKAYNGSGELAEKYSNVTWQYYKAFEEYNSALEKLGGQ